MKVKLQQLDIPNKNNRVYPKHVMEKSSKKWSDKYVCERRAFLCKKTAIGSSVVNLKDVIGLVNNIGIEEDWLVAEIECLKTVPDASFLFSQLEEGVLSVRLSGIGTITKGDDGAYVIGDDYELISLILTDDPA